MESEPHAPLAVSVTVHLPATAGAMVGKLAGDRFQVILEGHGLLRAYAGERVIVALERAQGLGQLKNMPRRLPIGCRRGGCGVCRVRVTQGAYRADVMSRAHISAEDEAAGVVLACCIYPRSDLSLRLESPTAGKAKGGAAQPSI